MLGSIECHVLQKMSQTVLVVFLLKCTHIVNDVEIRTSFRLFVMPDIIRHSVFKSANHNILVLWDFPILHSFICGCST